MNETDCSLKQIFRNLTISSRNLSEKTHYQTDLSISITEIVPEVPRDSVDSIVHCSHVGSSAQSSVVGLKIIIISSLKCPEIRSFLPPTLSAPVPAYCLLHSSPLSAHTATQIHPNK